MELAAKARNGVRRGGKGQDLLHTCLGTDLPPAPPSYALHRQFNDLEPCLPRQFCRALSHIGRISSPGAVPRSR